VTRKTQPPCSQEFQTTSLIKEQHLTAIIRCEVYMDMVNLIKY